MSAATLYEQLSAPSESVDLQSLANCWRFQAVEICVQGLGAFVELPGMLNKVRGALGDVLLEGASDAVKKEQICPWFPSCSAEVFFATKPNIDVGFDDNQAEIPKPFVLAAERHGSQDLLIRMTVFGLAEYWVQAACEALVEALQYRVHWQKLAAGVYFVPARITIKSAKIRTDFTGLAKPASDECTLSFITPLDTERTEISNNPHQVLKKLLIRVVLMARWQGVQLAGDLDALFAEWQKLECQIVGPVHTTSIRIDSGRNLQTGFREVSMFELVISGDLESLWPLLQIGETTHIGRGAVKGLGRYQVTCN